MKKEKQVLISQEPIYIENDFFNIYDTIYEIEKILSIRDISDGIQIIGIFDAFGEGKSSLIKTLKHTLKKEYQNKNYCFIELDLWKYENSELKNEFHKIFHNEKSNYFASDYFAGWTFSVASRIPITSKLAPEFYNKKFIETKITDDYFAYGLKNKIRQKKRKENCKNINRKKPIPIIIIENMDRLTIEEKSIALSSIYNYRDSFESHIIIALDPNSIRNSTAYFESLIHKCFTAYMYLSPKTKHTLKKYIEYQLPKISTNQQSIHNNLTEMLLTQYPISLRELNHCINTFIMSFTEKRKEHKLQLFMAILQVQFHQLFKAISQNPYILKKFIYHANDSDFDGYNEYGLDKEKAYKLNLLIKSLSELKFDDKTKLSILSPLNKKFLSKKKFDLNETIIHIELLRKAKLERDVIEHIEKSIKSESFTKDKLDKFLTKVIKDRETFINFFESSNFEEIFNILEVFKSGQERQFLEMILSYSVKGINDYSFYDNYIKTLCIFQRALKEQKYSNLLIHRILENFQLARKLVEENITIESNEYFVNRLKKLSFINKILYTTYFFNSLDSTIILTLQNIITKSIRDIDTERLNKIDKYKQDIIEDFYLKSIPNGRYSLATGELIFDIIRSSIFKKISKSQKVAFYIRTFNNNELLTQDSFELVIAEFSKLLNETFSIGEVESIIEILLKIKALSKLELINYLVLKKFISDYSIEYGQYDEKFKVRLLKLNSSYFQ